ncbi:hypothetical protein MPTK1_7g03110 [Marchantia polymorpha subsp. ruderalis]|uniref:Uncharacterized protein n=2 Tax=Marchantia polymorpha TaxID=3197 RepID=A0AAF6BVL8_MARPO|nr:hypothetical protein MARPO_0074s0085 [Marchantia polymorpha]BBN16052.1 hypothetical protein Mp_7g03110 [Marchantia polymorpha subsp. ruderalis]|eukprot:PTQ35113.1 hypothetical protein MARPO_0074s0085 [Marchantia polymorpha]
MGRRARRESKGSSVLHGDLVRALSAPAAVHVVRPDALVVLIEREIYRVDHPKLWPDSSPYASSQPRAHMWLTVRDRPTSHRPTNTKSVGPLSCFLHRPQDSSHWICSFSVCALKNSNIVELRLMTLSDCVK